MPCILTHWEGLSHCRVTSDVRRSSQCLYWSTVCCGIHQRFNGTVKQRLHPNVGLHWQQFQLVLWCLPNMEFGKKGYQDWYYSAAPTGYYPLEWYVLCPFLAVGCQRFGQVLSQTADAMCVGLEIPFNFYWEHQNKNKKISKYECLQISWRLRQVTEGSAKASGHCTRRLI